MNTLDELFQKVIQMHSAGQYAEADQMLQIEIARFPQDRARIMYWRTCMLALDQQREAAIICLREALDEGHWYAEPTLHSDPDLASLQGHAKFEQLVIRNAERVADAQRHVEPRIIVKQPLVGTEPYPLLVALHGNGSNADTSLKYWQSATDAGWLLGLPESSQLGGSDRNERVWNDLTIAISEAQTHIKDLYEEFVIDQQSLVTGGFSMGGQLAARLALKTDLEVQGLILVGSYLGEFQVTPNELKNAQIRGLRVFTIIGKQDIHNYDSALAFYELLHAYGITAQLQEYDELAHEYPAEFSELLVKALDFVIK